MEALIYFGIALVFNCVLPIWLPWWVLAVVNFFATFPFKISKTMAFWLGGFAAGISWLGYSLWLSHENNHVLAPRLTKVLTFPHPVLLFVAVFFIPFLVGGFASVAGVSFKNFFQTNAS